MDVLCFLPSQDPLISLPKTFEAWEVLAQDLPKLLTSSVTRSSIEKLPAVDVASLSSKEEHERLMLILSYLGHAYVWNNKKPTHKIPSNLAIPWHDVATKLGRPPVLSYASYALHNWRRMDANKPIELGNIVLLQNFLGGIDEEWFILIHVDIEQKATPGLSAILSAQRGAEKNDFETLNHAFKKMIQSLTAMCDSLDRMPEHCDPYIYFNRVRPYIHGWKDNPALPEGLIYEGVDEYHGKPQKFKGETGAQSAIIPCFDAALNVIHKDTPLKKHLDEMRIYMPPEHRAVLESIEKGPSIRKLIQKANHTETKNNYNRCLELIDRFRRTHLSYAANYIQKQAQTSLSNPTEIGTGGTPFMQYLKEHLDETLAMRIK